MDKKDGVMAYVCPATKDLFAAVLDKRGEWTSFLVLLFELHVSVFGVKTLRSTFSGCGNGGFLVILLLKALSEDGTFSRVKIQNLTLLVRPATMVFLHCDLPEGIVLEKLFRVQTSLFGSAGLCFHFFTSFIFSAVCILNI